MIRMTQKKIKKRRCLSDPNRKNTQLKNKNQKVRKHRIKKQTIGKVKMKMSRLKNDSNFSFGIFAKSVLIYLDSTLLLIKTYNYLSINTSTKYMLF